ncbi:hypothetical protein PM3016_6528 [Paenibacillus mucilaginosus 3016]|uniref:Uncharacterized protein n=2 Tax=Paenibacillus mucilaginosus TaxID=61624 RepID=H6NKL6_9BACL|nr:hypothetical protein PM3016_6528 [Paenibacillus mucilaginosus 3016]AGN70532.1 hypothetical protein B2K_40290 [Paenibacillus mucilaginosus K02]
MEGRLSVGLVVGVTLSIPLWMSMWGWMQLFGSAFNMLSTLHIIP